MDAANELLATSDPTSSELQDIHATSRATWGPQDELAHGETDGTILLSLTFTSMNVNPITNCIDRD